MKRLNWFRGAAVVVVAVVGLGVAAASLPDDEYQRYGSLEHTIQHRIRWIYERVHDDPAPIDVALVGSSRFGAGVSGPRLEDGLRRLGQPVAVVNFSLPENGRDLNWVLVDQMLPLKVPRLLIIGVIEKPGRYGHPAYKYAAPNTAVVDPGYFGNINYLKNLIYLPYRQMRLFAARFFPDRFDLPRAFDPSRYPGSNLETTGTTRTGDNILLARDTVVPRARIEALVAKYRAGLNPPILPQRLADIEFGDERTYVRRIVALAYVHHVRVAFLYMTYFSGTDALQEKRFYEQYGPIIDATWVARHPEWFSDSVHLNKFGARALTDWLAPQVAALLPRETTRSRRADGSTGNGGAIGR